MAITYKQCPRCHSKKVATILYGEPTYEAYQQAEEGKVVLGGCCVLFDGPEYSCNDCGYRWNKREAIEAAYARIKGINFSIGGFFEGEFFVEVNFETRDMKWGHRNEGGEKVNVKQLRKTSVDRIIAEIQAVNLLNWKSRYSSEFPIMDGTQWSLELLRDGRSIVKSGDNGFPDEWDPFYEIMERYAR
ncbi:hypothetical protein [Halobacillus aidingensis]|uniref:Uncharacterized protein n=1 Tax=Halobacillus aidingensis TaxID=240303 RepID=A0A1H0ICT9_HALAD|nr:hypothetical protein [Halobacillus aidingensis]SDO29203.1 hypothetical protein SAMN05421677_10442 [Halobacillus aidingensis]